MLITVPAPLHDEWLISVFIRHHVMSGNKIFATTVRKSINYSIAQILTSQKYEPGSLVEFIAQEQMLDKEYLVQNNSLLPFFKLMNKGICRRQEVYKFCSVCAREDLKLHGFAYWRRRHQLPGVTVCHIHKIPLDEQGDIASRYRYPGKLLPQVDQTKKRHYFNCEMESAAHEYANWTSKLLDNKFEYKDGNSIYDIIKLGMFIRNYANGFGRIESKRLYHDMLKRFGKEYLLSVDRVAITYESIKRAIENALFERSYNEVSIVLLVLLTMMLFTTTEELSEVLDKLSHKISTEYQSKINNFYLCHRIANLLYQSPDLREYINGKSLDITLADLLNETRVGEDLKWHLCSNNWYCIIGAKIHILLYILFNQLDTSARIKEEIANSMGLDNSVMFIEQRDIRWLDSILGVKREHYVGIYDKVAYDNRNCKFTDISCMLFIIKQAIYKFKSSLNAVEVNLFYSRFASLIIFKRYIDQIDKAFKCIQMRSD